MRIPVLRDMEAMVQTPFTEYRVIEGKEYELTWTATRRLEVSVAPIRQATTVCIATGALAGDVTDSVEPRALILRKPSGRWFLPGGRLEPGETPDEAARREVAEEATVELGELCLIGHQHVRHLNEDVTPYYQLRYAAAVAVVQPLRPDPDNDQMYERHWIPLERLNAHLGWERVGDALQHAATAWWCECRRTQD